MQSKLILTALVGASLAFAGCSAADKAKDAASATADKAADTAKDAAAATADKAKAGAKAAADKTGELASEAKDAANDVGGSAKTYGDKAAAKADEAAGSGITSHQIFHWTERRIRLSRWVTAVFMTKLTKLAL